MIQESGGSAGYWSSNCCSARFIYISLTSSLDHCIQKGTGNSSDTPPSLGRCSVVDNVDASSASMVLSELRDSGDEGVAVLKVVQEDWELSPLHMMPTGTELVAGGGEGIRNAVELSGELGALIVEHAVLVHLGDSCRVVEASSFFNECMETSISGGEECEEPLSCGLHGGLSIVRMEEELDNVGGFPWLPPSQQFHGAISNWPNP